MMNQLVQAIPYWSRYNKTEVFPRNEFFPAMYEDLEPGEGLLDNPDTLKPGL